VPDVPAPGVPESVAVPFALSTNVTPAGNVPLAPIAIAAPLGKPLAPTVNVPGAPTLKVTALPLVIAGAWFTVSVKPCVALGATPLFAVIVSA
jgi:hypothetical protein